MSSTIPLNSLLRHIEPLQDELVAISDRVIRSGYYVLGPHVEAFENQFARYCGVDHCIGVANGTDALELSLRAVGVEAGDRVAVVANAAMYSASAVLAIGAVPVFIDVSDQGTMAPASLRNAVESEPVSAIVVTHLYGRLADVSSIASIAHAGGMPLIEDCAQAHGARDASGRTAGNFGDIASFSFYPTKNLGALGDGGAVVTRHAEVAARMRKLRQYGWGQKYTNELAGGRNSRLDELQAAMLSAMLPRLDAWNSRRRDIANYYSTTIRNAAIEVPLTAGEEFVAHLFVVRTPQRDRLRCHLSSHGIGTDVHYPLPDHRQPCFNGRYQDVQLSRTECDAGTVLSLPCFPELTDLEVERVVNSCNRF